MDNILTLGLTPEEATQMQTELDVMLSELKRMREKMRLADVEIAASRARSKATLAEVKVMLTALQSG